MHSTCFLVLGILVLIYTKRCFTPRRLQGAHKSECREHLVVFASLSMVTSINVAILKRVSSNTCVSATKGKSQAQAQCSRSSLACVPWQKTTLQDKSTYATHTNTHTHTHKRRIMGSTSQTPHRRCPCATPHRTRL